MPETAISSVDSVICREITSVGHCTFDELVHRLPAYSWVQVFSSVDRLSRQGTLSVSRMVGVDYVVMIGPTPPPISAVARHSPIDKAQGRELAER